MKIVGARPGGEFRLDKQPSHQQQAYFIALLPDEARLTRCVNDLLTLDDSTLVIANWHGQRRTDAFEMTVGALRVLAASYGKEAL